MRRGFGLLQALTIIVLVSGILIIAIKYATISVKQSEDIYLRESAELFSNSVVEMSILAINGYKRDTANGCLSEINITSYDNRFIANVDITDYYLFKGSYDNNICKMGSGYVVHDINTQESHGFIMLNITVETNLTNPKNRGKKIKLMRRTLQRP